MSLPQSTPRRSLVIVRAGDSSLHPGWLQGDGARNWDLVVNYYGDDPDRYLQDDVERIDSKGPKWPALQTLITNNPHFTENYDYIWLPDDDLETSKDAINELFNIVAANGLLVAQPSLTWNSYFGHLTTLQNRHFKLRYTNYVEVMAPCFAARVLVRALPLFNMNLSGWGLDFIWPKLVEHPGSEIAIIDSVTVRHTRPVGGPNYKALRERGVSPWDELRHFCKINNMEEEPIIATMRAVYRDSTVIDTLAKPRHFLVYMIRGYLPALAHTPEPWRMLRRMAGMVWKALNNLPDRVAEEPMPRKLARRR